MRNVPLKPAPGWILCSPVEPPKSTLTYVNPNQEAPLKAKVLAVGAEYMTEYGKYLTSPVKVGDVIAHASVGYETLKEDGKEYRVMHFTKVLGVYEK